MSETNATAATYSNPEYWEKRAYAAEFLLGKAEARVGELGAAIKDVKRLLDRQIGGEIRDLALGRIDGVMGTDWLPERERAFVDLAAKLDWDLYRANVRAGKAEARVKTLEALCEEMAARYEHLLEDDEREQLRAAGRGEEIK